MKPGVYGDIPEATYHGGPELSNTGAKTLLDCPARYDWQRSHGGRADKTAYDVGHVVHELVLGAGAGVAIIDGNRNATDVKEKVAAAKAEGKTVLKSDQHAECVAIADAVHSHPIAGPIFAGDNAKAEQSIYWTDADTGVACRARMDWLTIHPDGRPLLVDLKTCAEGGADPDAMPSKVVSYGYDLQAAWYLEGAKAVGLVEDSAIFMHVFVEKTAPYPVTVCLLSDTFLERGRRRMRDALDLYADCTARGVWPTYTSDIPTIEPPRWAS